MSTLDKAASTALERSANNTDYEQERYEVLKRSPILLNEFVKEVLGTDDPASVQAGERDYLSEMEKRYGSRLGG
jgi:hypothetical protein